MRGKWIAGWLLLMAMAWALGESRVRIVHISLAGKAVEVSHAADGGQSSSDWQPALLNAPVVEAERVRTLAGGEAEVQLECGSALRLAPESAFSFPRLRLSDHGVPATTVAVQAGTALFTIRHADSGDFRVEVANAEVDTAGRAASFRIDAPVGTAPSVELLAGRAWMRLGRREYALRKKFRLEILPQGPVFAKAGPPDPWTLWSRSRDQDYQRAVLASRISTFGIEASSSSPVIRVQIPLAGYPPAQAPPLLSSPAYPGAPLPDPLAASPSGLPKVPYCAGR